MPKISIIIPVYNVEEYLRECLDSCINQTFKDIEIIVVNDCSPDNSDVIMREYEQRYPDLFRCVYLEQNVKLGGARNRGLDIALGKYVMFIDSDDWLEENACEELYKSAIENNADLTLCDWYRVYGTRKVYEGATEQKIVSQNDIAKHKLFSKRLRCTVCNTLYKKSLIDDSKCRFPENRFYEDLSIFLVWFLRADRINYVNKPLCCFRRRANSITTEKKVPYKKTDHINAIIYLAEGLRKYNLWDRYYDVISEYLLKEVAVFLTSYMMYFIAHNSDKFKSLSEYIKNNISDWEKVLLDTEIMNNYYKKLVYGFLTVDEYIKKVFENYSVVFANFKKEKKVFAVWGNGVWGKNIIEYLVQFDIAPDYVIDSNPAIWGTYTEDNIPIVSFDEVKDKCDIITVAIKEEKVYDEIRERIISANPDIQVKYFIEMFCLED